jgi:hypothetical protein
LALNLFQERDDVDNEGRIMNVSDLDDLFTIVFYEPNKDGVGGVRLVGNQIVVSAPYAFRNAKGEVVLGGLQVVLETTQEQQSALRSIIVAAFQSTNSSIEASYGWTKWTDTSEIT